ncbi:MAG: hypothetical protein WCK27_12440 [Verrucomicrobiota bacterium]
MKGVLLDEGEHLPDGGHQRGVDIELTAQEIAERVKAATGRVPASAG